MSSPHPTLAHQVAVIATILLWTLLSFVAASVIRWLDNSNLQALNPPMAFAAHFTTLVPETLLLSVSALVSSLVLLHFVRIGKLWHAAILAAIAFLLFILCTRSMAIEWLMNREFFFSSFGEIAWRFYAALGAIYALQVAIVFGAYRLTRWLIVRRTTTLEAATVSAAAPSGTTLRATGSTKAEWTTFAILFACLALLVAGGIVTVRELQLRQIPAPVWALLRESRDLEFLTININADAAARDFHGYMITRRVPASTPREREAVVSGLRRALTGWSAEIDPSSWPGRAIRITGETKTYDLLISFGNRRLILYEGDQALVTIIPFGPLDDLEALLPQPR